MKIFRLAIMRIGGYIKNYRLTFILFFLGAIISSFAFTYFYGNSLTHRLANAEDSPDYRIFEIYFSENEKINIDQLHTLDSYGILDVTASCSVNLPEAYKKDLPPIPFSVTAFLHNGANYQNEPLFTADELETECIMVDKNYINFTDDFKINGMQFNVTKTFDSGIGAIYAPIKTYMKCFGSANAISFYTADILTEQEIMNATKQLKETFPNAAEIVSPDIFIRDGKDDQASNMVHTSLMYIISLFSYLFLFKYMIDCSRLENIVYYLTGASKRKVFSLITLEVVILSTVSSLISILIHAVFYDSFFYKLNMTTTMVSYTLSDYLFILLTTVFLSLLATIPFIISSIKHTPITLKNICEE